MYSLAGEDVSLEVIFDGVCEADYLTGNPYNTGLTVNVNAHGFCGKSEWIVDFSDLKGFAHKLKELYDSLSKGEVVLTDREYGSFLRVECDGTGRFDFSGKLVGVTFQKLEFHFTLNQTYLKDFVDGLYSDFGKDYTPRCT